MIVIAIGANLSAAGFDTPLATCEAAVSRIDQDAAITVVRRSRWYESEPVPKSDQPWFVNGAIAVDTDLIPEVLLARLHVIEDSFGRVRRIRNEARPLDLDLIDYNGLVRIGAIDPTLPHPRAHERAFVMMPVRDLEPTWRHPISGEDVDSIVAGLDPDPAAIRPL